MKTRFNKKQLTVLEKIDELISEMKRCELEHDKQIILDLCLHGESVLEIYFEYETKKISENLFEMVSEIASNLDEEFEDFEEKEIFMSQIIYSSLDRYTNSYKLSIIRTFYQDNKTGKYANLIIDVLKESQFISAKHNHVYVNHNVLEIIMISGANSFYDEFGIHKDEFHEEFIKACENFHNQFKADYPEMNEFIGSSYNYFKNKGNGTRNFIRKIINNITKYLEIEVKRQPIFIDLIKHKNRNQEVILSICLGKKLGKYVYGDSYVLKNDFRKSELKKIATEIECIINMTDSNFDLGFVLDVVEEKLGIAA